MINKIHQNVRETLYRFVSNKNLHIIDKSPNTIVLVSTDRTVFNSAERLIKKEFGVDVANTPFKQIMPNEKQKVIFFEDKKVKYKCILDEKEHLNDKYTFCLMLTVSFLLN